MHENSSFVMKEKRLEKTFKMRVVPSEISDLCST